MTNWPSCPRCRITYIPIPGIEGCTWCDPAATDSHLRRTFDMNLKRPYGTTPDGRSYCHQGCGRPAESRRTLCATCRKHNQRREVA